MEASKLNSILEQHRLWAESNHEQGERANLRHAYLKGTYLRDVNLEEAYLKGVNLYYANLSGSNLKHANLKHANLKHANLTGVNLVGADLSDANLECANLECANLRDANLTNTNLSGVNFKDAIVMPDISWIIPGCLAQLSEINCDFYLIKERKYQNFVQDSLGFIIQDNLEEETFDMLIGERIVRGIPDWVKYSGLTSTV